MLHNPFASLSYEILTQLRAGLPVTKLTILKTVGLCMPNKSESLSIMQADTLTSQPLMQACL
jgi:hypothetical protein